MELKEVSEELRSKWIKCVSAISNPKPREVRARRTQALAVCRTVPSSEFLPAMRFAEVPSSHSLSCRAPLACGLDYITPKGTPSQGRKALGIPWSLASFESYNTNAPWSSQSWSQRVIWSTQAMLLRKSFKDCSFNVKRGRDRQHGRTCYQTVWGAFFLREYSFLWPNVPLSFRDTLCTVERMQRVPSPGFTAFHGQFSWSLQSVCRVKNLPSQKAGERCQNMCPEFGMLSLTRA
jgi:hypothetical protein